MKLTAKEFFSKMEELDGDFSGLFYEVIEEVAITTSLPYRLRLGRGVFHCRFSMLCGAQLLSLDFQEAVFAFDPEISARAVISTIYNDRDYFESWSKKELSDKGLLIPSSKF